jgi:hypothetical protein
LAVTYTLVVTPNPATVFIGRPQRFSAVLSGDDGTTLPAAVTWTSTAGTIDDTGLLTPDMKLGAFTVTATQAAGS